MSVLLFRFYAKESHVVVHTLFGTELHHMVLANKASFLAELQLSAFNNKTPILVVSPYHGVDRHYAVSPHHLLKVHKLLTSIHITKPCRKCLHTVPLKPSGVIYLKFFITHL